MYLQFIIYLILLFIQLLILSLWYRIFYYGKTGNPKSFVKVLTGTFIYGFSFAKQYFQQEKDDGRTFYQWIETISMFFILPGIVSLTVAINMEIGTQILFFISGFGLWWEQLTKAKEELIRFFIKYNHYLAKCERNKYKRMDNLILKEGRGGIDLDEISIQKNQKIERWTLKKIADNSEDIIISQGLCPWREEIINMCRSLGLKNLRILIMDEQAEPGKAIVEKNVVPEVRIGRLFFEEVCNYFDTCISNDIIKMVIGHELVHIYFYDSSNTRTYIRRISAGGLIGGLILIKLMCILRNFTQFLVIGSLILIYGCIIINVMTDERYWGQVKEFRADRIGKAISQTSSDTFKNFSDFLMDTHRYSVDKMNFGKDVWREIYQGYIEVENHPSLERRMMELKRGKNWGRLEYVRYATIFRWRLSPLCGKGWKL